MHVKFSSLLKKLSGKKRRHDAGDAKMNLVKKKAAPRGFVPVCVGEDRRRYEIPVECLNSLKFKHFLKQHQEDILAAGDDPIRLICPTIVFESVLNLAKAEAKRIGFLS